MSNVSDYVIAGGREFAAQDSELGKVRAVDRAMPQTNSNMPERVYGLIRLGTLVTTRSVNGNQTIYVAGSGNYLYGFASERQFIDGGFDPALVVTVPNLGGMVVSSESAGAAHLTALSTRSDGALVVSGHTVYVFAGGAAFPIPNPSALAKIEAADKALPLFGNVAQADIGATPASGVVVSTEQGGVYVSYDGSMQEFASMSQFLSEGYGGTAAVPVP